MEETLIAFLLYINDECTDEYGNLQIITSNDEEIIKDYYFNTPKAIVSRFLERSNSKS